MYHFITKSAKPYKFIGFGAMDVTKPYKLIVFGAKIQRPDLSLYPQVCQTLQIHKPKTKSLIYHVIPKSANNQRPDLSFYPQICQIL